MENPERIKLITKSYYSLQGLRWAPLGVFMALIPWVGSIPNHYPIYIGYCVAIATFLFCAFWIWLAGRYYRRRFGRVESKPQSGWASLFWMAYGAGYALCTFADYKNPPVSFVALCWAFSLVIHAVAIDGIPVRRYYYSIAAVCVTILALVPSTGWVAASQLLSPTHPSGLVFVGLLYTALSLLDHFQLVRMFEHPPESVNA